MRISRIEVWCRPGARSIQGSFHFFDAKREDIDIRDSFGKQSGQGLVPRGRRFGEHGSSWDVRLLSMREDVQVS